MSIGIWEVNTKISVDCGPCFTTLRKKRWLKIDFEKQRMKKGRDERWRNCKSFLALLHCRVTLSSIYFTKHENMIESKIYFIFIHGAICAFVTGSCTRARQYVRVKVINGLRIVVCWKISWFSNDCNFCGTIWPGCFHRKRHNRASAKATHNRITFITPV